MKGREYVLLLNEKGEFIGTEEKYDVHTTHTPLHLAFSCWLFNSEGQVLTTRRSLGKKAWPGVWTNSVCGHPQLNESFEQAITRRCHFEVGAEITDITPVYPEFRYCATDTSGIMENEICPVYAAKLTNTITPNPDEVMDCYWVSLDALYQTLITSPRVFSPWMVLQFGSEKTRKRLMSFVK
ncbi:isopentenyl-diphosphate Delta-isomerase [Escherichia coli]|uniref:isopentenyl-diphosphate Delta-isomerase n=1 Tax=Escherichia coli TaxID=562 RepID=UPI0015D6A7D5